MFANWLRIILIILTSTSFLPQLRLIWLRKHASGISLCYVLFNLITASEQFGINFAYAFLHQSNYREKSFVHDPMTAGDWLNLAQTTLFMLLFVAYLSLCLWFPSDQELQYKGCILGVYIAYFLIAIAPLLTSAIIQQARDDKTAWSDLPFFISYTPHGIPLNFLGTILAFLGTYYQVEVLESTPSSSLPADSLSPSPAAVHGSALSALGLAIQAPLSLILAVSWIFRVPYALSPGGNWWDWYVVEYWYECVGAVAVDNAAFAVGQGFILCLVLKPEWFGGGAGAGEREREPLLRGDGN